MASSEFTSGQKLREFRILFTPCSSHFSLAVYWIKFRVVFIQVQRTVYHLSTKFLKADQGEQNISSDLNRISWITVHFFRSCGMPKTKLTFFILNNKGTLGCR